MERLWLQETHYSFKPIGIILEDTGVWQKMAWIKQWMQALILTFSVSVKWENLLWFHDEDFILRLFDDWITLTDRVWGSYCKLRTEFYPHQLMAQARSARTINRRGKTGICNLRMNYISTVCLTGSGAISIHAEWLQISDASLKQKRSIWNRC